MSAPVDIHSLLILHDRQIEAINKAVLDLSEAAQNIIKAVEEQSGEIEKLQVQMGIIEEQNYKTQIDTLRQEISRLEGKLLYGR